MPVDLRKVNRNSLEWSILNLEKALAGTDKGLGRHMTMKVVNMKVISHDTVTADIVVGDPKTGLARRYGGCKYQYRTWMEPKVGYSVTRNELVKVAGDEKKAVSLLADFHRETAGKGNWLHGIEHLTKDSDDYVYWKSIPVERFNFGDDDTGIAREKHEAERLAGICMWLEEKGMEVSLANVIHEQKACDMYEDLSSGFGCERRVG